MPVFLRNLCTATTLLALLMSTPFPLFTQLEAADAIVTGVDIYNFGRVSDTYYRGAEPDKDDVAALARLGVKTVIDLQRDGDEAEPLLVEQAGMKYVRIPMTTRVVPTAAQLEQFLALVNDPAAQPVYVHCKEGRHRTGVMTAVYRMTQHSWSADQAFKEMKDYRFGMDFLHPEFKRFVFAYRPAVTPDAAEASAAVTVPVATN